MCKTSFSFKTKALACKVTRLWRLLGTAPWWQESDRPTRASAWSWPSSCSFCTGHRSCKVGRTRDLFGSLTFSSSWPQLRTLSLLGWAAPPVPRGAAGSPCQFYPRFLSGLQGLLALLWLKVAQHDCWLGGAGCGCFGGCLVGGRRWQEGATSLVLSSQAPSKS